MIEWEYKDEIRFCKGGRTEITASRLLTALMGMDIASRAAYTLFMQTVQPLALAILGFSLALLIILVIRKDERNGEWLRSALSHIGDAFVTTDRDGRICLFSPAAEKLTGWTSCEAIGKPFSHVLRLVDHDTRAPLSDPAQKMMSSGESSDFFHTGVLISRSGAERPVDVSAAPIIGRRNRIRGVTLLFRDVTARYTMEQKLAEREEKLRTITETAQIGLVMIDRERRYVYANNYYLELLGLGGINVAGRKVESIIPLLYEKIRPNLDGAFEGKRFSYQINGFNRKEIGENRLYRVTYEPQIRQALITHVVIVVLDITDIKQPDA